MLSMDELMDQVDKIRNAQPGVYGTATKFNRVLLCDVSGSMNGDKFDGMRNALLMNVTDEDGIVVFGENVYIIPYNKIEDIKLSSGQTSMLPALKEAINKMKPTNIVLMTDGDPNKGGFKSDVQQYLAGIVGVRIDCIGIGDPSGNSWCDDLDEDFLKGISEMTGGVYQHVSNPSKLGEAIKLLGYPSPTIAL